jgi:hypothetical protein
MMAVATIKHEPKLTMKKFMLFVRKINNVTVKKQKKCDSPNKDG